MTEKKCKVCGQFFECSGGEKYCSPECRKKGYGAVRRAAEKRRVIRKAFAAGRRAPLSARGDGENGGATRDLPAREKAAEGKTKELFVCSKRVCLGCTFWRPLCFNSEYPKFCDYIGVTGHCVPKEGRTAAGCAAKKERKPRGGREHASLRT